jgi:hypothetical protein
MSPAATPAFRLSSRDTAKFAALVALAAIFVDAAIGHGLTWENDPYWTYWITKTFLIATVFGLGTSWFGIGEGRGAVITVVHTVILTVYYWSLSPIGLPSSPDWLDLEHTWITGVPIHFLVIYVGYLLALWLWRRRAVGREDQAETPAGRGVRALVTAVVVVVLAGGLSAVALFEFQGVTWYVVRLLITVPFLLLWWAAAGRDRTSAVTGGIVLAFIFATYSEFLGPIGLPDLPLRIFTTAPPPATVRWLDYKELWLISLPIYIVATIVVMVVATGAATWRRTGRAAVATVLGLVAILFSTAATIGPQDRGQSARLTASGDAKVETGPFFSNQFGAGTGTISITATNMGGRVTPLPPHDVLLIDATVRSGGGAFTVTVRKPMVEDPLGRFTTWWGVGFDVWHHGKSGIGSSKVPATHSELAAFGVGDVSSNGKAIATGVPVHVMTMPGPSGEQNEMLELDVGDPEIGAIGGLPEGHLRVQWSAFTGDVSSGPKTIRYIVGLVVLIVLLLATLGLNRTEAGRLS